MATKAIKPKRDEGPLASGWQSLQEQAPSLIRPETALAARYVALFGLMLVTLGAAALLFHLAERPYLIGPGFGFFLLVLGVCALLFHAFAEKDVQYRRLYGVLSLLLLGTGVVLRLLPVEGVVGGRFLPYGALTLIPALAFSLAFIRNETDVQWRGLLLRLIGLVGALMALAGFIGGNISTTFLLPDGLVLALLGLLYLGAYIILYGGNSDQGYWAAFGLGVAGGAVTLVALGRTLVPPLVYALRMLAQRPEGGYFIPAGLILTVVGVIYLLLSVFICSDRPLIVLTRRELTSFFYSPVAYLVLTGILLIGWFQFWQFVGELIRAGSAWEPILLRFFFALFPVICLLFVVPVLTMRLLSEEQRVGTLEVLLTAPVNEWTVVLSKFFAALIFYLLAWLPWGVFLVALRVFSGEAFDYRPLLSFAITFTCTGAGFVAAGLFCSSMTRNQIIAAVFTFVIMLAHTGTHLIRYFARIPETSGWMEVLTYVSYLDLWLLSLQGLMAPRFLVFHLSLAVFFLFLSVKVLEARKWT